MFLILGAASKAETLLTFCEAHHPNAKTGLATCFVERCLIFATQGGTAALVTPENWLSMNAYRKLRIGLLKSIELNLLVRLGAAAFQTPMWDFNIVLLGLSKVAAASHHTIFTLDAGAESNTDEKAHVLCVKNTGKVSQMGQLTNPDSRIGLSIQGSDNLLSKEASSFLGLGTGDFAHYGRCFWEFPTITGDWAYQLATVPKPVEWGGREHVIAWDFSVERVRGMSQAEREQIHNQDQSGQQAWGKKGVAVGLMGELKATIYAGEKYEKMLAVLSPRDQAAIPALWAFCTSREFYSAVRQLDNGVVVANTTLAKVPFDYAYWQRVAAEQYPNGLPEPDSNDLTQWLFNGQLADSTAPLQVGAARLLGYRWPRQAGQTVSGAAPVPDDGSGKFADEDGIVCIPSVRGEIAGPERLRALLAAAYGKAWTPGKLDELLGTVGYAGSNLEDWLRNGFFEQHCKLFHHRPFIWHVWDGRKDGFSALVNYHKLDHKLLEKLTYTYLGDWIKKQQEAVASGESGADDRLVKAQQLQEKLKLILEGEAPYDIFVRWKPLEQQPIGWHPDLNDGVRLNIRPFMRADVLRKRPNIKWGKDRGKNPPGSPWGEVRDNDRHLTLSERQGLK